MDTPLMLINLSGKVSDPKSQFVINEEAAKVIESMDGPIGVISVAGLYRTGKSFILNQLAGRTDGFDIGASIQPQTQGIWMWALDKPSLRRRRLPDTMNIVLLDTEGLGSFTKTETHDVKIFALAVLLSSYLIYNSLGTIDDTAIENMSLIVNLTRSIREKVSESDRPGIAPKVDPVSLRQFFPRFMWLLRDFSLELKIEGRDISQDEYLEHALRPLEGKEADIVAKNKVRETIRSVFHQRTCYTLKRPVDDEDQLQELGSLKPSQFRKDYLEEVERLIKLIYQNVPPKTLYGTSLTGAVLVAIMKQYVSAINSGSVPVISSAWESVLAQKTDMALADAKSAIAKSLPDPTDMDDPLTLLGPTGPGTLAEQKGTSAFLRGAVLQAMSPAQIDAKLGEIHTYAAEEVARLATAIVDANERTNTEAATRAARVAQKAIDEADSIDAVKAASDLGEQEFASAGARGRCKEAALHQVGWTSMVLAGAGQVAAAEASRLSKEMQEQFEEEMGKAKKEYATLQELYQSVDKEWQKEQANAKSLREQATELRYEIMGHQKTIKSLETDLADLAAANADLTQKLADLDEKHAKEHKARTRLEAELEAMTAKQEAAEKARAELEDKLKDADSGMGQVSAEREELMRELDSRQEQIEAMRGELEQAYAMVDKAKEETEAKVKQVKEEADKKLKQELSEAGGCNCTIM
ncbi:guanylate-binding protein [Catenaria anguillulae PL171]|uniref:Guanylate-binding protein n=1 Tax=Catenaria anguillulae PL171 TaxID=765915 RepID=A0A1Y2HG13_9FUNG|nr:guanylate-binding protein [Catenaria anguillulae PL171]